MYRYEMSIRFLVVALALVSLSGCMQELAEVQYNSTEEGYEHKVAENMSKNVAKQIAANANVPVVVNNPYAFTPPATVAANNVPVINNNAYGSLAGNVIQPGVFMQNQVPVYQVPTSFGNNYYSPAMGR